MRPSLTWGIALACLLLLGGAMAWATWSLLAMERTQHRMAADAAVQERLRLGLWRMESIAASLLVAESARTADSYRPGPAAAALGAEARVLLHFELDTAGRVTSPEAPEETPPAMVPSEPALRLRELRARLAEGTSPEQWALPGLPKRDVALDDNKSWMLAASCIQLPAPSLPPVDAAKDQSYSNWKEAGQRQQNVATLNSYAAESRRAEQSQAANMRGAPPATPARVKSDSPASAEPEISDFRALWIKDALFLTRRVSRGGGVTVQGAWVDWPKLRGELLGAVRDLFSSPALEPAPTAATGGTDLLASLPVRLVPGPLAPTPPPYWSPLKLSLGTAWLCVLLASGAVVLLLRGMVALSERRASFVSAVTHELRTPLATFKLYSEMLADGLVKEETKRQQYLETLSQEADRLGHLVENVLSYSRLERGNTPEGRSPVSVAALCQRIEPRLAQRAAQAGAQWQLLSGEIPGDLRVTTDPAAVEQILFNLVDNACKYARRDGETAPRIELALSHTRTSLLLAVRDFGPGVSRAESKKLFRAFHKSAREAAHSAPGVGLGLALCRRLATDLGGSLEIDHTWPHGACFTLKLPA